MAVTISQYDLVSKLLLNKEVNFATLKVMLLDGTGTFTAANVSVDDVAGAASPTRAKEVSGNGWPEGGPTLTNVAVTVATTNDAMLDADDVVEVATGGDIGPAENALVYDSTTGNALWHISFGQPQKAGDTTEFKIVWNDLGLLQAVYT